MKKVIEDHSPLSENHAGLLPRIDFTDTFATTNHMDRIEEITKLIFSSAPKWIEGLFALRNSIAGMFGLRTTMPEDYKEEFKVGSYTSFFKIYAVSEDEVVIGANDSHLNFRALVCNDHTDRYNIKVITLVEYNNRMGRIYMTIIKPFHRLVVMRMVRNAFKKST